MGLQLEERKAAPAPLPGGAGVNDKSSGLPQEARRDEDLYGGEAAGNDRRPAEGDQPFRESWALRFACLGARLRDPVPALTLRLRARRGLEDRSRWRERLGHPSVQRPKAPVIWIHAPDAEAAASASPLINVLGAEAVVLVTTATVPASFLISRRLPASAVHQYAPVENAAAAARFLDHWKPDAALWVSAPLSPVLLRATVRRRVPVALLNAKLTDEHYQRLRRRRRRIAPLLGLFCLVAAPSQRDAARLRKLGAGHVHCHGDLRHAAAAAPVDEMLADNLRRQIATRPIWAAVNTVPGEEELVIAAHRQLLKSRPDALLLLCPRPAYRAAALADRLKGEGWRLTRRTSGEAIRAETQILLLDGPVDAALAYRLAPLAFLGGSLLPEGGNNPFEAAHQDCAIISGPHMEDHLEAMAELRAAGAVQLVNDLPSLALTVERLLADPSLVRHRAGLAAKVAAQEWSSLQRLLDALTPFLSPQRSKVS